MSLYFVLNTFLRVFYFYNKIAFQMQQDLGHSLREPALCPSGPFTRGVTVQRSGSGYPEGQTFNHIVAFVCF